MKLLPIYYQLGVLKVYDEAAPTAVGLHLGGQAWPTHQTPSLIGVLL